MLNLKTEWGNSDNPLASFYQDAAGVDTTQAYIFAQNTGQLGLLSDYKSADGNPIDTPPSMFPIDTVTSSFKSGDGNPFVTDEYPQNVLSDNGGIYPIDLTDKSSKGVFEEKPVLRNVSYKSNDGNQFVVDHAVPDNPNESAIIGTDPAALALTTFQASESPLQATMQGNSGFLSGTDPFPVSPQDMSQTTDEASYDSSKPSDCGTFDFACKWKSINQEVYLFIVGAIVLAIGIYAVTRSS